LKSLLALKRTPVAGVALLGDGFHNDLLGGHLSRHASSVVGARIKVGRAEATLSVITVYVLAFVDGVLVTATVGCV